MIRVNYNSYYEKKAKQKSQIFMEVFIMIMGPSGMWYTYEEWMSMEPSDRKYA